MEMASILLVEDTAADSDLTIIVFKELKLDNPIHLVTDGEACLEYLRTQPPVDIIILDENLPRLSGLDTLAIIKKDEKLKSIPVMMLTTSEKSEDISRFYALGGNSYLCKPLNLKDFMDCISKLGDFWFKVVKLPPKNIEKNHLEIMTETNEND